MSKAMAARRLVTAAAVCGAGLGLFGGSLYGVLNAEAKLARRRIGNAKVQPPDPGGLYGGDLPGEPLRLAVLGDSGAAGYGATVPAETFGAFLATGLVGLAQRPVHLHSGARVGARTAALADQITSALKDRVDVCAIIIGANDVTHKVRPSESVRLLKGAVHSLRAGGSEVVVGTCPDLGAVRLVAPPLRQVVRSWSRRLAAAQAIAVVEAGGRAVSLASLLSPTFTSSPAHLFGPDQFHPSTAGYRSCAAAMLPTVASAAGVELGDAEGYEPWRGEGVFSLAWAAAAAAGSAGTEVSQASRGRWALLRHRRRVTIPDAASIETELDGCPEQPAGDGCAEQSVGAGSAYSRRTSQEDTMALHHSDETHQLLVARVPEATGSSLDEWFGRLDDGPGLLRFDERVLWLQDEYGVAHGHATAIVHEHGLKKAHRSFD